MSYFLISQKLSAGQIVELGGEEVRHILLARRMKKGEKFNLQGSDEIRYAVEIKEIKKNSLKLIVLEQIQAPPEPETQITIFQAVVSEKALDFIFQKGTELGAYKIVLFNSANVAAKVSADQFNKKLLRWQKILVEAAKQCDRVKTPALELISSVDDVLASAPGFDKVFLLDPDGQSASQSKIPNLIPSSDGVKSKISIIIGPEGGFTQEEIEKFKSLPNCIPISLGPILLRAETAALASLAIFQNLPQH